MTINYNIFNNEIVKDILKKFKRKCPRKDIYIDRLATELDIIIKKEFYNYIFQVYELLDLVRDIPFIIRGSSGSSLVCYLLGITNIDPVEDNISFARFLNETRESMPDVDFDFPYNKRDEVFERIDKHWEARVARISNHVIYQEKSATREAIRQSMIKNDGKSSFISKSKCNPKFFPQWKLEIENKKKELMGTMRCYSLHCGGIVIYDDKIPDEIKLETKNKNQIKYNKDDVSDNGLFKIDILSNRGLAQLFDISDHPIENYPKNDELVTKLFAKGHNIGLTFAESPAMRKLLALVKPKDILGIAFCLALVRPAAANGFKSKAIVDFERGEFGNYLIFDDDAIHFIKSSINCDEGVADKYRRAFSKNKKLLMTEFDNLLKEFNGSEKVKSSLRDLRKYSFCKSHAISYAKLVWALAYCKVYFPQLFWLATLNHCNSSYRKWVHYNEAKTSGIELCAGKKPYKLKENRLISLGGEKKSSKIEDPIQQYKTYGFWITPEFLPNMYLEIIDDDIPLLENQYAVKFRGVIAIGRVNNKNKYNYNKQDESITFVTIGYDNGKYIDLTIKKTCPFYYYDIVEGEGLLTSYDNKKVSFSRNTNKIMVTSHKMIKL
jgi:DNA polymerase-3 subunit alpha